MTWQRPSLHYINTLREDEVIRNSFTTENFKGQRNVVGRACYNKLLQGKILGILMWLGLSWIDSKVFSSSYKSLHGQFSLIHHRLFDVGSFLCIYNFVNAKDSFFHCI